MFFYRIKTGQEMLRNTTNYINNTDIVSLEEECKIIDNNKYLGNNNKTNKHRQEQLNSNKKNNQMMVIWRTLIFRVMCIVTVSKHKLWIMNTCKFHLKLTLKKIAIFVLVCVSQKNWMKIMFQLCFIHQIKLIMSKY